VYGLQRGVVAGSLSAAAHPVAALDAGTGRIRGKIIFVP
jgi:hypothetical protein